jgi:neutral ceramidase
VLDDGKTELVLATVDSCMVPRSIFDAVKSMIEESIGIPSAHMLMAATHSHTAPCATPVFQTDPDPDYMQFLTRRISDAVVRAHNGLVPARVAHGSGTLPEEVHNRRWHMKPGTAGTNPFGSDDDTVKMNPPRASANMVQPAGPIDPEIAFLAVEYLDGQPMALLANYSLHYVGGTGANEASADYFGIFADRISSLLGVNQTSKPFIGMMSNGTSGDINNIDFTVSGVSQKPFEQMTIVAHKAADRVHAAYQELEFQEWVELNSAQREVHLGVRLPSKTEVEEARILMASAKGPDMVSYPEIYARETVLLSEYPSEIPLILQVVCIGDLAIAGIPCEVFVEIGLEIKGKSPFSQTFTMELANGYNGYLPTAEQHGYGGYETWRARSSYLEVSASETITKVILELLRDVAPQD